MFPILDPPKPKWNCWNMCVSPSVWRACAIGLYIRVVLRVHAHLQEGISHHPHHVILHANSFAGIRNCHVPNS